MPHNSTHAISDLKSVLERRDAWLKSAGAGDTRPADTNETPFVRSVIERCRKLQYELAVDRYFERHARHDH